MKNNVLTLSDIYASTEGKTILHGISFAVSGGQVHAIMGPNGSGKSTLAHVIMGSPRYLIDPGNHSSILLNAKEITTMPTDVRARLGLFLAFQNPIAIPGVSVMQLLRLSYQEIRGSGSKTKVFQKISNPVLAKRWAGAGISIEAFTKKIKTYARSLDIADSLLSRSVHDGFSGGERKKVEMLQALVLSPKFAVFDEIDTGLDVDALKSVAKGIRKLSKNGTGVIVITHYQRILKFVKPDFVHIMVKGNIVANGKATLAKRVEDEGYAPFRIAGHT